MVPFATPNVEDSFSRLKFKKRRDRVLDQFLHNPALRRLIPGFIKSCRSGVKNQAHGAGLLGRSGIKLLPTHGFKKYKTFSCVSTGSTAPDHQEEIISVKVY